MKFNYFKAADLEDFESEIKYLALEKNYKYNKSEETLDKDKIIKGPSSSTARTLLKEFNDKAKIIIYSLSHRKSNYIIAVGIPLNADVIGVRVVFDRKPFKQVAKGLIGLPLVIFTGPIGVLVGITTVASSARRMYAIRGPLGKSISNIITDVLGEPIQHDKS